MLPSRPPRHRRRHRGGGGGCGPRDARPLSLEQAEGPLAPSRRPPSSPSLRSSSFSHRTRRATVRGTRAAARRPRRARRPPPSARRRALSAGCCARRLRRLGRAFLGGRPHLEAISGAPSADAARELGLRHRALASLGDALELPSRQAAAALAPLRLHAALSAAPAEDFVARFAELSKHPDASPAIAEAALGRRADVGKAEVEPFSTRLAPSAAVRVPRRRAVAASGHRTSWRPPPARRLRWLRYGWCLRRRGSGWWERAPRGGTTRTVGRVAL